MTAASSESLSIETTPAHAEPGRLARHFIRYTNALAGPTILDSARHTWLPLGFITAIITLAAMYIPGADHFFGFRPLIALLGYLPVCICSLIITVTYRRTHEPTFAAWVWLICGSACVQLLPVSWMAASKMPGAAVFASMFLFGAAYHGFWFRVTLANPYMAIGTTVMAVIGVLLNPDYEHVAVFAVITPAAVASAIIAGGHARLRDRERAENERLRAAIDAQLLAQQEQEVRQLSRTLVDVMGANHDLRNAVTSVQLMADSVIDYVRDPTSLGPTELRSAADDLQTSLQRLQELVERTRPDENNLSAVPREGVDASAVIRSVVTELARHFPATRLRYEIGDALFVQVRGGEVNLRRIVRNLVQNACEGDGRKAASVVTIRALRDRSGHGVELTVTDDGPGFAGELLASGVRPYTTTKSEGTGLGLFTIERLVRASDGFLRRMNQPKGGAVVMVALPLARPET